MSWRPRFDSIYQGPWPYRAHEGVGLEMSGFPTDLDQFELLLAIEGCHPSITEGIVNELAEGPRKITVAHVIDFDQLALDLQAIGVSIAIITPRPGWGNRVILDAPWPQHLAEARREAASRTLANGTRIPKP